MCNPTKNRPASQWSLGLVPFLIGLIALPLAARATDGLLEINQAAVVAGGITPGDAPGWPLTIAASGSYRLTGDLDVSGLAGAALSVEIVAPARTVTLDLGGFAIDGGMSCSPNAGTGATCALIGGPNGIGSTTDAVVVIRDGTLRGFRSGIAVTTARSVTVEDVRSVEHTNTAIFVSSGIPTLIRRAVASVTAGRGIDVGSAGRVFDSVADHNSNNGISAAEVVNSSASFNGVIGIDATFVGGRVLDSRAFSNGTRGVNLGNGGLASGVVVHDNAAGLLATAGSSVVASTFRNNAGVGISAAADATYSGCTLTGNNGGGNVAQVSGGIQLGTSFCGTDTVCP